MKLLEDLVLASSIEIKATPEEIFGFFLRIVDDVTYRAWHPEDHVAFRWIKGEPWRDVRMIRQTGKLRQISGNHRNYTTNSHLVETETFGCSHVLARMTLKELD